MSAALDRLTAAYYNPNPKSVANPGGLFGEGAMRINWPLLLADVAAVATEAGGSSTTAAAALAALLAAPGTNGTSATATQTIGTGARTITTQTAKAWVAGMWMLWADAAAATTNWIWGQVTSYNSVTGQLVLDSKVAVGAGTPANWVVSLTGPPTNTTTDTFTITQALRATGLISPAALGANTNDWAPAGFATCSRIRASASAAYNLTGLAGGADGRAIILENVGAFNITMTPEAAGSTAANRFDRTTNYVLKPKDIVLLVYDATTARWRVLGGRAGASAANLWAGTAGDVVATPEALAAAVAYQAKADGATITWTPISDGLNIVTTLGGNRTLTADFTGLWDGAGVSWELVQDGTGTRVPSFDAAKFDFGSAGTPLLQTAINKRDLLFGVYRSATGKVHFNFRKGA